MSGPRRRRGDFVRATASVLTAVRSDGLLTPESGARFCDIAVTTCGAWRAALFVLSGQGPENTKLVQIAQSEHLEASVAPLADKVSIDLVRRALQADGPHTFEDLLIGPVAIDTENLEEDTWTGTAIEFLVLQATPVEGRDAAFADVDRQRLQVLITLVALKEESARSTASGALLARVNGSLTQESTMEGKLNRLAAFLAEATNAEHTLVWTRQNTQSGAMHVRASFPQRDLGAVKALEEGSSGLAMQRDLVRMSSLEHATSVATSVLPWLSEILHNGGMEMGEQAIVTPIRRGKDVVGVAISSTQPGMTEKQAAAAALERRALLRALSDQIALTTEYMRTTLSAQQSARRYALLAAIGEISLAKIGMEEMIDAILARVQEHFDVSTVQLHLLGSDRASLRTRVLQRHDAATTEPRCEIKASLLAEGKSIGALTIRRTTQQPFDDGDGETLGLVADQLALALATSGRYQVQASLAILDALTNLPNRRSADAALDREVERAQREGSRVNIALLDIDHFKLINDTYGHDTGDTVLREIGKMFKAQLRATDFVARYGGEEFLVLLPNADRDTAQRICERLRHSISLCVVHDATDHPIPLSASLGGSTFPDNGTTREVVVQQADAALYKAKAAGRSRICWANTPSA